MPSYKPGNIVVAKVFFAKSTEFKYRPVVVAKVLNNDCYEVCKITHRNHSGFKNGKWIIKDSDEWVIMGLFESSFVLIDDRAEIHETDIIEFLGTCPFMDDIEPPDYNEDEY